MLVRLFMIPWSLYLVKAQNNINNIPNTNSLVSPQFYEFIQRQNQFNNALLLHNAILHNSMAANLRENQLNNGLVFGGHAPLAPMPIPTIDHNAASGTAQFHTPILNHQTGNAFTPEDHLGIYETLYPMSADGSQVAPAVPSNRQGGVTSFIPKSALSESGESEADVKQNSTKKLLLEPSPEVHGKIKQIERTTTPPVQITSTSPKHPPTTIGSITVSTEAPPAAIPDVVKLLKQLNLTEIEQQQLIHHVEQVVREELAKKLIETKLSSFTLAPRKPTTEAPKVESTTVVLETTRSPTTITPSSEFIQRTEKKLINIEQNEMAKIQEEKSTETKENQMKTEELELKLREEIRLSASQYREQKNTKDLIPGAIKTSERHIAIEERGVENEDETAEELIPFPAKTDHIKVPRPLSIREQGHTRPTPRVNNHRVTHRTTPRVNPTTTTTVKPESTTDDFVPELPGDLITEETQQTIESTTEAAVTKGPEEELDPKKAMAIPRRSFLESDSDLLEVATGAPLDLSEANKEDPAYRSRHNKTPGYSERSEIIIPTAQTNVPIRPQRIQHTHSPTDFEKLATDYRERLSGTGDINKILKSLYQNAYIQLVENSDPAKKIRKPYEPKRSEARFG